MDSERMRIENIKTGMVELFNNTITHNNALAVYKDTNGAFYLENRRNCALLAIVEKGTIKMRKSSYFTDYVIENIAKPYHLNIRLLDNFSNSYRVPSRSRYYPNWSAISFIASEKKFVFNQR